jgi:hypothetical protein
MTWAFSRVPPASIGRLERLSNPEALGAPTSGADRIYFGVVAEVKTRVGVPYVSVFFNAIEQAESYEPGRPAVVTVLDVLNGVKYFVRRGP